MIETIPFTTEDAWRQARALDVTSTEIAALFGCSPYLSEYELWHRKRDKVITELEANERMTWGLRLQDSIAAGVAQEQGWTIRRMTEYLRDPELRLGASFDFGIDWTVNAEQVVKETNGLLEVKNVDSLQFKRGWLMDKDLETGQESIESPPHIELQAQQQLLVSGRAFLYLGALVGGNTLHLLHRLPDPKIHAAIRAKVRAFWASIEANTPPEPDFKRDARFIAQLYGFAEPGKVLDAMDNERLMTLMAEYQIEAGLERDAKARKDALKAEVLTMIGEAEKVYGVGWTISAGMVGPTHVSYDRKGYRTFRPSFTKKEQVDAAPVPQG